MRIREMREGAAAVAIAQDRKDLPNPINTGIFKSGWQDVYDSSVEMGRESIRLQMGVSFSLFLACISRYFHFKLEKFSLRDQINGKLWVIRGAKYKLFALPRYVAGIYASA